MRDEDDPLALKVKTILFWVTAFIIGGIFYLGLEVGFPHLPKIILRALTIAVVIAMANGLSKLYHDT